MKNSFVELNGRQRAFALVDENGNGFGHDYSLKGCKFWIDEELKKKNWSLVKNVFGVFTSYLFVNVISTKTGRYYRVLFS